MLEMARLWTFVAAKSGCRVRGLPDWFADVLNPDNTPGRVIDTGEGKAFHQQHFTTGEHWHQLLGPHSRKVDRQRVAKPAAQALMYMVRPMPLLSLRLIPFLKKFAGTPSSVTKMAKVECNTILFPSSYFCGSCPIVRYWCDEALSDFTCSNSLLKGNCGNCFKIRVGAIE